MVPSGPQFYHFSIDDVLDCLLEVSRGSQSLFDYPFFSFLQQLNREFGASCDLYLFGRQSNEVGAPGLAMVPDHLQPELAAADWLRFGPHALERATPPHAQSVDEVRRTCEEIYRHILRFAGRGSLARWLRFHYFSECYEQAEWLRSYGVSTLLTTDKPACSYRLPWTNTEQLRNLGRTQYNGLNFVRSHIRTENLIDCYGRELDDELDRLVGNAECAVIFTHEYELEREEVRMATRRVLDWVRRRNLKSMV